MKQIAAPGSIAVNNDVRRRMSVETAEHRKGTIPYRHRFASDVTLVVLAVTEGGVLLLSSRGTHMTSKVSFMNRLKEG